MAKPVVTGFNHHGSSVIDNTVDTSHVAVGDLMWAIAVLGNTTTNLLTPSGWTLMKAQVNMGSRRIASFAKVKTEADGNSTTFFKDANSGFWRVGVLGIRGAKSIASAVVGTQQIRPVTATPTVTAPSVTTPEANCLNLIFAPEATTADETGITSSPGATTLFFARQNTNADITGVIETIWVGEVNQPAANAATGDVLITWPNAAGSPNAAAYQVSIPGVAAVDDGALAVKVTNALGGLDDAKLYSWNAATGKGDPIAEVKTVQDTVASSADLLTKSGFVVAHRLGSLNWPEHSMHGATQSLLRGVDALEFSVGITLDDQWFGLHDATLDRTSGVSGNINPKTLTWAQIQANYQILSSITDDTTQPNQPYMLLKDLLDAYPKAVMFIDPKNLPFAKMTALFQWLKDNVPNATERFVLKYYYDYTALKNAVMDMGFRSWGYLYTSDISNANFATYCQRWTWLGLENSATQANWDLVKAQNPRVLGHIAQTLAAFQSGISKGAVGGMVSGVKQVKGF